jgi:hypothetical protein
MQSGFQRNSRTIKGKMAANGYFNLWILGHFPEFNRLYLDFGPFIIRSGGFDSHFGARQSFLLISMGKNLERSY